MKLFFLYRDRAIRYFRNHVEFNALTHVLGGIALGILIASPIATPHPVRWALILGGLSIAGHLYAITVKK